MNEPSTQIHNTHRLASILYCDATRSQANTSLRSRSVRNRHRMPAPASTCTFPRPDRHPVLAEARVRCAVPAECSREPPANRTRDVPASLPTNARRSLATESSFVPEVPLLDRNSRCQNRQHADIQTFEVCHRHCGNVRDASNFVFVTLPGLISSVISAFESIWKRLWTTASIRSI